LYSNNGHRTDFIEAENWYTFCDPVTIARRAEEQGVALRTVSSFRRKCYYNEGKKAIRPTPPYQGTRLPPVFHRIRHHAKWARESLEKENVKYREEKTRQQAK
jgi:hypothetical protein